MRIPLWHSFYLIHPGIRLRGDPVRAECIGERVAADREFRRDDPAGSEAGGSRDRVGDQMPVLRQRAGYRGQMQERDA